MVDAAWGQTVVGVLELQFQQALKLETLVCCALGWSDTDDRRCDVPEDICQLQSRGSERDVGAHGAEEAKEGRRVYRCSTCPDVFPSAPLLPFPHLVQAAGEHAGSAGNEAGSDHRSEPS